MTMQEALKTYTEIVNNKLCKTAIERLQTQIALANKVPLQDKEEFYNAVDNIDRIKQEERNK